MHELFGRFVITSRLFPTILFASLDFTVNMFGKLHLVLGEYDWILPPLRLLVHLDLTGVLDLLHLLPDRGGLRNIWI